MTTPSIDIANGEKFALITLPNIPIDGTNLPQAYELTPGLWFTREAPFTLGGDWAKWIGSIKSHELLNPQLMLLAKRHSKKPGDYDEENEELRDIARRFYAGLHLTMSFHVDSEIMLITGANDRNSVDVRSMNLIPPTGLTPSAKYRPIGLRDLEAASRLVPILAKLQYQTTHMRLQRVLNVFYAGINERAPRERLHQFCRCIEGLILAKAGKTTKQFKSRTELFVGPRDHELMEALYENRSAVEHMNDMFIEETAATVRENYFCDLTLAAEYVARYSISKILRNAELLQHYRDETSLASFWDLSSSKRKELWGKPLDLGKLLKDRTYDCIPQIDI